MTEPRQLVLDVDVGIDDALMMLMLLSEPRVEVVAVGSTHGNCTAADAACNALRVLEVDGRPRIGISDKGIPALHSLINARQEMFDNVYWHHTNRACMAMLLRAIQEGLATGVIGADALTGLDDAQLLALLSTSRMPMIRFHSTCG